MKDVSKKQTIWLLLVCGLLTISGCKGDEESEPTDERNFGKEKVLADYQSIYLATEMTVFPWNGSTSSCTAGSPDAESQQKTLQRINYFRELAGLPGDITFRDDWNQKCMEAALMCHANNQLNHFPPNTWNCYTADGNEAAGRSNLSSSPSTRAVVSYMQDRGAGNIDVGHRRWILFSRAKTMGHGATNRYDALWVSGGSTTPSNPPESIAWPPEIVPAPFVWDRWSLSVPGGDFANANVKLTSDGSPVSLNVVSRSANFGDPTIVFEPTGIDTQTDDKVYSVEVSNVMVGGVAKTFSYDVTIVLVD